MKGMILIFFLPFLLFSQSPEKTYAEKFGEAFSDLKIEECQRILESWEQETPQSQGMITGLKATLSLATGDIEKSAHLLETTLDNLIAIFSQKVVEAMCRYYRVPINWLQESIQEQSSDFFPYRGGVAQIIAGFLLAPFNEESAGYLINSGASSVIAAVLEALNHQENWEEEDGTLQTEVEL